MAEILIREYEKQDIPAILELFSISFHKKASLNWFLWKYEKAPWSSKGYVGMHDGHPVAFYGGIRFKFGFRGKRLLAYQFCDVMTHPEFRGRLVSKTPLIVRLGEMFYKQNEMDFAFGFPSIRHARLQSLRLGGEGYRLVRAYRKELPDDHPADSKLRIKRGWKFLSSALSVADSGNVENSLYILKSEKYFKWRYINHPSKKYELLVFKRLVKVKGFVIFTLEDYILHILEIGYKIIKDIEPILSALEVFAKKNIEPLKGIKLWFHKNEPVMAYLDKLGYIEKNGIPMSFRPVNLSCGVTPEIFYENYFYRMGDYDAA